MKRELILFSLAALALGGCSSKVDAPAAEGDAAKSTVAAASAGPAKPNPWASDGAASAVRTAAASAAAAPAATAAPVNPWAKDPPPG